MRFDGADVAKSSTRLGHLVLSREAGTSIMIGDLVEVKVERIRGCRVILYVTAPEQVAVLRKEVWTPQENEAK